MSTAVSPFTSPKKSNISSSPSRLNDFRRTVENTLREFDAEVRELEAMTQVSEKRIGSVSHSPETKGFHHRAWMSEERTNGHNSASTNDDSTHSALLAFRRLEESRAERKRMVGHVKHDSTLRSSYSSLASPPTSPNKPRRTNAPSFSHLHDLAASPLWTNTMMRKNGITMTSRDRSPPPRPQPFIQSPIKQKPRSNQASTPHSSFQSPRRQQMPSTDFKAQVDRILSPTKSPPPPPSSALGHRSAMPTMKLKKWQQIFDAAEMNGWDIRVQKLSQSTDSRVDNKKSNLHWPFMTPQPKRITYETALRQQSYSSATARSSWSRRRGRSTSPPSTSASTSSSTRRSLSAGIRRPPLPFTFDSSTPMPVRSTPASIQESSSRGERKFSIASELERLDVRRYEPITTKPSLNQSPKLSDPTLNSIGPSPTLPDSTLSSSSTTSILQHHLDHALVLQRTDLMRQLEDERQSWQAEKALIWRHYQTDIERLMRPELDPNQPAVTSPSGSPSPPPSTANRSSPLRVTFQPLPSFGDGSTTESTSTTISSLSDDDDNDSSSRLNGGSTLTASSGSYHPSDNLTTSQLDSNFSDRASFFSSLSSLSPTAPVHPPLTVSIRSRAPNRTTIDWSGESMAVNTNLRAKDSIQITHGTVKHSDGVMAGSSPSSYRDDHQFSASEDDDDIDTSSIESKLKGYNLLMPQSQPKQRRLSH